MFARVWSWCRDYPLGVVGALLICPFLLAALLPWLAPYDPIMLSPLAALADPSPDHWLGTDTLGRDQLSRIIYGARPSLGVGFGAVILSLLMGTPFGLLAGYRLGLVDLVMMRLFDALQAFPSIVLALVIAATLGPGAMNAVIAVAIVYVPIFARLARGQTLSAREQVYVEAARAIGASDTRIIARHLLPNITSPLMIQFYLTVAYAVLLEATLSFLGVGIQPPAPSWGSMLKDGYQYVTLAPSLSVVPGSAIFLLVLGLTLLGDAIWSASDPRQSFRRRASRGRLAPERDVSPPLAARQVPS
jgi:peptide/nickel transport system permease protein